MDRKTAANFAALLVTLLITFATLEAGLRLYYGKGDKVLAANDEQKCAKELFRRIAEPSTVNRFHPLFTSQLEYVNYSGVRPKPSLSENKVFRMMHGGAEFDIVLYMTNTNSQRLRALRNFSYEKNPNVTRIAVLGDSFAWGADVPHKYSFASLLEELTPNSEVLNFGIEGIGIDTMYLRWKHEAVSFRPDVVIFSVYVDDIRRARPCINKPRFARTGNKLEITNIPPPSNRDILEAYKEPEIHSYFLTWLSYLLSSINLERKQYDYGLELLEPMLIEMMNSSGADNTFFMVLLIEAGNDKVNNDAELHAIKKARPLLERLGVPYISSAEIFRKENFTLTNYSSQKLRHFTPEGNAVLAHGIRKKLEEAGIVQPQKEYYAKWRTADNVLLLTNRKDEGDVRLVIPYEIREAGGK